MYHIEMKILISGSNDPRSVIRAHATASSPQAIRGDGSEGGIEIAGFLAEIVTTVVVTELIEYQ